MRKFLEAQQEDISKRQIFDTLKYLNASVEAVKASYQGLTEFTNVYGVLNQSVGNRKLQNINISTTFGNESITDPSVPEFRFRIGSILRYEKVLGSTNKDPYEVVNFQTLMNNIRTSNAGATSDTTLGRHTFKKNPDDPTNQYVEFKGINVISDSLISALNINVAEVSDDPTSVVNINYVQDQLSMYATKNEITSFSNSLSTLSNRVSVTEDDIDTINAALLSIPTSSTLSTLQAEVTLINDNLIALTNSTGSSLTTLQNTKISNTGDIATGSYTFGGTGTFTIDGVNFVSQNNTSTLGTTTFTGHVNAGVYRVTAQNMTVTNSPTLGTDVVNLGFLEGRIAGVDAGTVGTLRADVNALAAQYAAAFGGGSGDLITISGITTAINLHTAQLGRGGSPQCALDLDLETAENNISTHTSQFARTNASALNTALIAVERQLTTPGSYSSGLKTYIDTNFYTKSAADSKYATSTNTYTKAEVDAMITTLTNRINRHATVGSQNVAL